MKLPFEKKELEELTVWIGELAGWSKKEGIAKSLPALSEIYLLPLTLALLRSTKTLSRLTWALIFLTGFLVVERIVWIVRLFLEKGGTP